MNNGNFFDRHDTLIMGVVGFALIAALLVGVVFAGYGVVSFGKNFSRSQRLADERNQIQVNSIQIQQTRQLVQVAQQKADIKIEEAKGIAQAQKIINDTLTPQYLQHEAIQSQETQSNKIIYVPSGNQGIPLVNTVNP